MKLLFLDALHSSSSPDTIRGGSIKVCWDQIKHLAVRHEILVISSKESVPQYSNQHILSQPYSLDLSSKQRAANSRANIKEIGAVGKEFCPDLIVDHLCEPKWSIYRHFKTTPKVFYQHGKEFPRPMFGIHFTEEYQTGKKEKFEINKTLWVTNSHKTKRIYFNLCHEVSNLHVVDYDVPLRPREKFGVMVTRWDLMKQPHSILDDYFATGLPYPIKMFLPESEEWYNTHKHRQYVPLEPYQNNKQIEIFYRQSRNTILDTLSSGSFFLGTLNEASGIAATESAATGLPYVVQDRALEGGLGEKEHMPPETIFISDATDETTKVVNFRKILEDITEGRIWSEEKRVLSRKLCQEKFSIENFISEQERVFTLAVEKYKEN